MWTTYHGIFSPKSIIVMHIPDGKDFDWWTKDKPRQVTSRIVVGLSSIVFFFLLDGNVEDYQSQMMFEHPSPSTFISARILFFRRNWTFPKIHVVSIEWLNSAAVVVFDWYCPEIIMIFFWNQIKFLQEIFFWPTYSILITSETKIMHHAKLQINCLYKKTK